LNEFGTDEVEALTEFLQQHQLPGLTALENMQLIAMLSALGVLLQPQTRSGLDDSGRRFMVAAKVFGYQKSMPRLRATQGKSIDVGTVAWGMLSESQDALVKEFVTGKPDWMLYSPALWVQSLETLKKVYEDSAKVEFQKTKRIEACTVPYIALGKAKLLSALHKMKTSPDASSKMVDFYSRDFTDAKNKSASNKNAYVLMGKGEHLRAIGFYLLGGALSDAINVAIKNLNDVHLAVLLSRCIEGDDGPVLKQVVSESLVPQLLEDSEYLLASVLLWRTKRLGEAYAVLYDAKTCFKLSKQNKKSDEQSATRSGDARDPSYMSRLGGTRGPRPASFSPAWYHLLCEMRCKVEMLPHLARCPRLRTHEVRRHLAYVLANLGATVLALEQLNMYRQQERRRQERRQLDPRPLLDGPLKFLAYRCVTERAFLHRCPSCVPNCHPSCVSAFYGCVSFWMQCCPVDPCRQHLQPTVHRRDACPCSHLDPRDDRGAARHAPLCARRLGHALLQYPRRPHRASEPRALR
jgi:hypothetical protein